MPLLDDISNQRFGRLTVIERAENSKSGKTRWRCQCDCGNTVSVQASSLKGGITRSCGCLQREIVSQNNRSMVGKLHPLFKHGDKGSRLYTIWRNMKKRCNNPNRRDYKNYGGRGIVVCDEWLHDYTAFHNWAMANGYDPDAPYGQCTLDRIDVDGNYCPQNCRWVSMAVQNQNKQISKHKER